jgi:hypothetical protein
MRHDRDNDVDFLDVDRLDLDPDAGEPLAVLDLDDGELGLLPEDRYAAIPPGPRLVPRRVRRDSPWGPVALLAAVVALFTVGAWLDSAASDRVRGGADAPASEPLTEPTGTTLLLTARAFDFELDVDRARVERAEPAEVFGETRSTLAREHSMLAPDGDARIRVISADDIIASGDSDRVWFVAPAGTGGNGRAQAQEVDVTTGAITGELEVDGTVVGAVEDGLVVERPSRTLEVVGADGAATVLIGDELV